MIEELSQGITEQAERLTYYMRKANTLEHQFQDYRRKANTLEHQFQDFINQFKRWWDNSVLTDPNVHEHLDRVPPFYKIATSKPLRPMDYAMYDVNSVMDLKSQTLYALEIAVERDLGERHMHILLRLKDNVYKYYIDERALYSFEGMPEKMVEYAWKEIVYAFKEKFKNDHSKRP